MRDEIQREIQIPEHPDPDAPYLPWARSTLAGLKYSTDPVAELDRALTKAWSLEEPLAATLARLQQLRNDQYTPAWVAKAVDAFTAAHTK
jgi:hypothetical protein